jgi:anti-sigma factor RsiW
MPDDTRREQRAGLSDRELWQRSRMTDATEDEAERALDLAGFADGCLDPDDRERIAEWLAGDPSAAGDVAAARALAARVEQLEAAPEPVIARASALVGGGTPQRGTVVAFTVGRRDRSRLRGMAGWGSLVAAMAVASWLGFTLGMDTSLSFGQAGEDGFLREMLDPGAGFMRELTEGNQT